MSDAPDRPTPRTAVLIVADDPAWATSYARWLAPTCSLIRAAGAEEARRQADAPQAIDAAVVELRGPLDDPLGVVRLLSERSPVCRSLVVTRGPPGEVGLMTMRAGAHALLRLPCEQRPFVAAVVDTVRSTYRWRAALGQTPPRAIPSEPLAFDLVHAARRLTMIGGLTPSQTIAAWRVLWGDNDAEIANRLGCTVRTVKSHVGAVLSATGARSRSDLLRVLNIDAGIQDPWLGPGIHDRVLPPEYIVYSDEPDK